MTSNMTFSNGVILDRGSLDNADLDFDCLNSLVDNWQSYDHTNVDDTLSRVKNAEVIISNKVIIDKTILEQASRLKLVCIAATGTNNVDLVTAKNQGIRVCNVTGYATNSVVQHVFSLIFILHRKICQYDALVRNKKWDESKHFCRLDYPITELTGKTLGIIGYGELGKAVAKAAEAFGLKVIIAQSLTNKKKNDRVELADLFSQSDIISIHCPLTSDTEQLINQQSLALMKPECILINTSRGGVINEKDLLDALKNNTLAAAGLDVLNQEPPEGNILTEANLHNLIITPHIAWASHTSRQRLVNEIGENIKAYLSNTKRNIVA